MHEPEERYFVRLTLNQRVQHIIMMISFFTLVFTGLPVRYASSPISYFIVHLLGGFEIRALIHRVAAMILIGVTGYHAVYSLVTPRGRADLMAMIPKPKDGFDALNMILFYLGFKSKTPQFDRFNFIEKFEYLALGWGTVVMVGTGLILWFESQAMAFLPKWALDVAKVIHSYEAMLAFLAIIIWHFYHVHFNPEVFPMSRVWLTGMISEHELKENHPLEYARIMKAEKESRPMGNSTGGNDT
ncbi:MAG: formate dehydrogenase subunit gamma [Armatimonadota bacterium]